MSLAVIGESVAVFEHFGAEHRADEKGDEDSEEKARAEEYSLSFQRFHS